MSMFIDGHEIVEIRHNGHDITSESFNGFTFFEAEEVNPLGAVKNKKSNLFVKMVKKLKQITSHNKIKNKKED